MKSLSEIDEGQLLRQLGLDAAQVIIVKREQGVLILDKSASLTDLLTGLIPTLDPEWHEEEYAESLLRRSE